jgi:hypothetical protein
MKHMAEIIVLALGAVVALYVIALSIECNEKGGKLARGVVTPVICVEVRK